MSIRTVKRLRISVTLELLDLGDFGDGSIEAMARERAMRMLEDAFCYCGASAAIDTSRIESITYDQADRNGKYLGTTTIDRS